jgi:hypothetical protein
MAAKSGANRKQWECQRRLDAPSDPGDLRHAQRTTASGGSRSLRVVVHVVIRSEERIKSGRRRAQSSSFRVENAKYRMTGRVVV